MDCYARTYWRMGLSCGDGRLIPRVWRFKNMARVRTNITINGRDWWALFDTGAVNIYIVEEE